MIWLNTCPICNSTAEGATHWVQYKGRPIVRQRFHLVCFERERRQNFDDWSKRIERENSKTD